MPLSPAQKINVASWNWSQFLVLNNSFWRFCQRVLSLQNFKAQSIKYLLNFQVVAPHQRSRNLVSKVIIFHGTAHYYSERRHLFTALSRAFLQYSHSKNSTKNVHMHFYFKKSKCDLQLHNLELIERLNWGHHQNCTIWTKPFTRWPKPFF